MPSFWAPSTRVPLDVPTLLLYVLPPMICGPLVAVLAVAPGTRAVRVALWPVAALLALRAVVSVDMSLGKPERKIFDAIFACAMVIIVARALDFAFTKQPPVRHVRPANSVPSTIMDAIDLALNYRGLGWNWSHGLHIPRDARPTNRVAFAFCAFLSAAGHAFAAGVLHRAILSFPGVGSTANGPTIFDDTLPFSLQYLRASIISTLSAFVVYASLQAGYDLCTVPAVLLLGHEPAQWPPAFDAPWRATSLIDFWGHRWHQWGRHAFLVLGGRPLAHLTFLRLGRAGTLLGAFLASAVMHDVFLLRLDRDAAPWRELVGFGAMGPLVLAERALYKATGRKVGGVAGWVWTMAWLVVLGNGMVEGAVRAGVLGDASFVDGMVPVRALVARLVTGFDGWLHAAT